LLLPPNFSGLCPKEDGAEILDLNYITWHYVSGKNQEEWVRETEYQSLKITGEKGGICYPD